MYKYSGYDASGNSVKGAISASSIDEAKERLRAQHIVYKSVRPYHQFWIFSTPQMPIGKLSDLSVELSSYLRSGMNIVTAIKLMTNQHEKDRKYTAFLTSVKNMLQEGKSLYSALTNQSIYRLPPFFTQSLDIAGQSGKIVEVLQKMASFFSLQNKIRRQSINAITYPTFIFIVAMGMSAFLLTYVVPKITAIFEDTQQELPEITKFVLALSEFVKSNYLSMFIIIIVVIGAHQIFYKKSYGYALFVDRMLLRLPLIKAYIQNAELGRFAYILSLMLESGISYAHAVKLASATIDNRALREHFDEASKKVLEGKALSSALKKDYKILKKNFLQSLALGEETSEVGKVMENLSLLYAQENEDRVKIILSLLEPVMMLIVGLIVGIIVSAMLLPIFSMSLGA